MFGHWVGLCLGLGLGRAALGRGLLGLGLGRAVGHISGPINDNNEKNEHSIKMRSSVIYG